MFTTGVEAVFPTVQTNIQTEAANNTALALSKTEFDFSYQKISSAYAAILLPKTLFALLSPKIGSDNFFITFKGKHFSDNFRVLFFPEIKTLILSGYYKEGMAHLIYIPGDYEWLNGMGYKINSPECIGEKFESRANKLYPFLSEFFL